jgi:hypothetical protein
VFLYTPQEEDWGKYLVKAYDDDTIANGQIYLERPSDPTQPPTTGNKGGNVIAWPVVTIVSVALAFLARD